MYFFRRVLLISILFFGFQAANANETCPALNSHIYLTDAAEGPKCCVVAGYYTCPQGTCLRVSNCVSWRGGATDAERRSSCQSQRPNTGGGPGQSPGGLEVTQPSTANSVFYCSGGGSRLPDAINRIGD